MLGRAGQLTARTARRYSAVITAMPSALPPLCALSACGLRLVVAPEPRLDILAFAERVLPSASNLWVQSSLAQKQRLQQVFFPDGVRFDGKRLVGTGATLPVFNYLNPISDEKKEVVDQTGVEPVTS